MTYTTYTLRRGAEAILLFWILAGRPLEAAPSQTPLQPPPTVTVLRATTAPVSSVVDTSPPPPESADALPPRPSPSGGVVPKAPPKLPKDKISSAALVDRVGPTPLPARKPTPAAKSMPPKPTPTPVATPTPAPTPVPQPFHFYYMPPLSVEEAGGLLRASVDVLSMKDPPTLAARCQKAKEMIDATSAYLNGLDRRHSSLVSYQWHLLDSEKVDGPGMDRDVFLARPMIHNVSAISFAATFGDVYVHLVEVQDAAGQGTTFTLERLVEEKYPHEQICYLFFPTTIRSVAIQYQAKGPVTRTPRLAVFAGIALQEEYLKQALWYLRYARRETDLAGREPVTAAEHLNAACQNLRLAAQRLIRFRVKQY